MRKGQMVILAGMIGAVIVLLAAKPQAQNADPLVLKVRAASVELKRYIDLLQSKDQATRLAALAEMGRSADPAIYELAIESGLSSPDRALKALALRLAFARVRSIVARVEVPAQPTKAEQEAMKHCVNGASYLIEGYRPETGHFEARGQGQSGAGSASGTTVSITLEYGCSLAGELQADGTFAGLASAPYQKGAFPARFSLR